MKSEIKARDNLTDHEVQEIADLSLAVYPPGAPRGGAEKKEWSRSEWCVLIRDDDGNLVSYMGLITRQAKYDKTPAFIGGIGGVKTHPDARGQGYAGHGLQKAADYLRDELNVDFSLLICRDELIPYYSRFGWQAFKGDMLVDQSQGKIKLTFNKPMLLAGQKSIPECNVIDLCGKPW